MGMVFSHPCTIKSDAIHPQQENVGKCGHDKVCDI
jgi:hypothetical protein